MRITEITDAQIDDIAQLPVTRAAEFGRRNVALYALNGANSGLKDAARERCVAIWNAVWEFDLDNVKALWLNRVIDTATHDDAMIDIATKFPAHTAKRWRALARCAALWNTRNEET